MDTVEFGISAVFVAKISTIDGLMGTADLIAADSPNGFINFGTSRIEFAFVREMTPIPAINQIWVMCKNGIAVELIHEITAQTVIFADSNGGIAMVNMPFPSNSSSSVVGSWQAVNPDPATNHALSVPSYLPYAPTPCGFYTCSIVLSDVAKQVTGLNLLAASANIPRSPSVIPKRESIPSTGEIREDGIKLSATKFYYRSGDDVSRALAMHRPFSPEYPPHSNCIVAYPIDSINGNQLVWCSFETSNPDFACRVSNVRAIIEGPQESYLVTTMACHFWANHAEAKLISAFGKYTGYLPFEVDTRPLIPDHKVVGEYPKTWLWQYCLGDPSLLETEWIDIERVHVCIYLTVGYPTFPWAAHDPKVVNPSRNTPPHVGLVINACRLAAGATNPDEVATFITKELANSSHFVYDGRVNRFTTYRTNDQDKMPIGSLEIDAVELMETISGLLAGPIAVDCVDLSRALLLLANSIGGTLKIGMIKTTNIPDQGFSLNSLWPLGSTKKQSAGRFQFHQVAYIGDQFDENAKIYDPCVQFIDENGQPQPVLGVDREKYLDLLVGTNSRSSILCVDLQTEEMIIQ